MRIITGSAKGVKLSTLDGLETRPTSEMVKEAIFSAIQFQLHGALVLDLFGGSGQLALEALSRGALSAVIVDNEKKATDIIRANALKSKLFDRTKVVLADWKAFIKSASAKNDKFSLLFLDPPYKDGFIDEVLKKIFDANILSDDAIIVCESAEGGIPSPRDGFSFKLYRYGKTFVTIIKPSDEVL